MKNFIKKHKNKLILGCILIICIIIAIILMIQKIGKDAFIALTIGIVILIICFAYLRSKSKERKSWGKIVKTMIVSSTNNSRKKASSSIARGVVGGAVFGVAGAVGGSLSGKNITESKTTFLVEYESGHRETIIVDTNSNQFNKLCKYLDMTKDTNE